MERRNIQRALKFKYDIDNAFNLCEVLKENQIRYSMMNYGSYGCLFFVLRSGKKWNDVMGIINSVKAVRYSYSRILHDEKEDKYYEVVVA